MKGIAVKPGRELTRTAQGDWSSSDQRGTVIQAAVTNVLDQGWPYTH